MYELSAYLNLTSNALRQGFKGQLYIDKDSKEYKPLIDCLEQFGNIYEVLCIGIFVNDLLNELIFPSQLQNKSNFNIFITNSTEQLKSKNPEYINKKETNKKETNKKETNKKKIIK